MLFKRFNISAFTLVELIVVIAILAVLSVMGFLAFSGYSDSARDVANRANVRSVYSAISSESALSGESPRKYIVFQTWATLSGATFSWVIFVPGSYSDPTANYTAGIPDWSLLRLDPLKFRIAKSDAFSIVQTAFANFDPLVGAIEVPEILPSGKSRTRSFFQVAGISSAGRVYVEGNFPTSVSGSISGLIKDPTNPTEALIDSIVTDAPIYASCSGATWSGTLAIYDVPDLGHDASASIFHTGSITNGTLIHRATASCDNGNLSYSSESVSGDCDNGYAWNSTLFSCQMAYEEIDASFGFHACGILSSWVVKCWGYNASGQLGNNSVVDSASPVNVSGLTSGISNITTGHSHTCALTTSGGVKCWGYNAYGGLGDGTVTQRMAPIDVVGLSSGVKQVDTGWHFSCALTTSGGVKCWGYNVSGQLGNNSTTNSSVPVDVVGLSSGVERISVGYNSACALTTSGGVKCWGYNAYGGLGNNSTTNSSVPVDVVGLSSGVERISVGTHDACALTTSGGVKCWGFNHVGQLGNNSTTNSSVPVDVVGLSSGVEQIFAGNATTCAVLSSGVVKCWGWNAYGQFGNGTVGNSSVPVVISSLSRVTRISIWAYNVCAIVSWSPKCWGSNGFGQLGIGITTNSSVPVDVVGLSSGVAQVGAWVYASCAVTSAGEGKCWGFNGNGRLGNNTNHQIAAGSAIPGNVSSLSSSVEWLSMGYSNACALTTSGGVKCWGYNAYGSLGNGSTADSSVPVDVVGLSSGVSSVSVGTYHACAVLSTGALKCWGYNAYGGLGDGTAVARRTSPVDVVGLSSGVSSVSAGYYQSCAVLSTGAVKCWGYNLYGQLGNGSTTNSSIPVDVVGLSSGVSSISTGYYHACALTTSGGVKCWGLNAYGGLGNGIQNIHSTPKDVNP